MKKYLKIKSNWVYVAIVFVIFVVFSLLYNTPVFTGNNALSQSDIINYKGGAQEMLNFEKQTGENIYWSDAMFAGMPTYQSGASYQGYWIKTVDQFFRFLPRPADYLFLLLAGFFFLGIVLFKNWKYALLGSFMFALGTYYFIIIEAGHNAKIHAIAYFPPLMASIILLYRGRYILGFLSTAFFMALELMASHPQMTYYFGFVVLFYLIFEFVEAQKNKNIKEYFIQSILAIFAVLLAFGMNSSPLMATKEYAQYSTRGKNDVNLFENTNQNGLDKSYITDWSYGKIETLNLFIPNFMGGSSLAQEEDKSNLIKAIGSNVKSEEEYSYYSQYLPYIPIYWGGQPFTSGPAYQGAIVILLFILGSVIVPGKWKWWLLSSSIFSILLAWGKNMMWLTDLFIDYVPLYDKFRAVSSILVIAEFTMPLLAIFAVYQLIKSKSEENENIFKKVLYVSSVVIGCLLILYLFGPEIFSFSTVQDSQIPEFMASGIRLDRIELFRKDTLRTLIFVSIASGLILAYLKNKIERKEIVILGLSLLTIVDLWSVDKRYLNDDDFISKQWVENPFPTEISQRLIEEAQKGNHAVIQMAGRIPVNKALKELKEKDKKHYRVFNTLASTFNETGTSYFASSLGGYHGAKLQNYQNIIDLYFSNDSIMLKKYGILEGRNNILNLLNTKYVVVGNGQEPHIIQNPENLGNVWFVDETIQLSQADSAIVKIGQIDVSKKAIVPVPAQNYTLGEAEIKLKEYNPISLKYESKNANRGFAVFSEIYYPRGWKAYIDGKEKDIVQTNYFLRGLEIPAGEHEILFKFEPSVISIGNKIMIGSNILFILLVIGGIFYQYKFADKKES